VRAGAGNLWEALSSESIPTQRRAAAEFRAVCAFAVERSLVLGAWALRQAGAGLEDNA